MINIMKGNDLSLPKTEIKTIVSKTFFDNFLRKKLFKANYIIFDDDAYADAKSIVITESNICYPSSFAVITIVNRIEDC